MEEITVAITRIELDYILSLLYSQVEPTPILENKLMAAKAAQLSD